MFLLVKNAEVYAPARIGRRDILAAGGVIVAMVERIDERGLPGDVDIIDAKGAVLAPGLIDCHVHLIGGGGEGGFATRTPELSLSDASLAGVTTVIGVLGTDGVARHMESLVAKVYGLREEGLSAWCYTGSYRIPMKTVTGDAMKDIMMIEPVIGIGETAVSDHRSSKPSHEELSRLAAEARVGGMLSGKAGVVNVHLGDAPAGMAPLEALVAGGDLPRSQLLPTHCGRNPRVFAESIAWAKKGGTADFTTSGDPRFLDEGESTAAQALARFKAEGVDLSRITWSSDGQGSLPVFDTSGAMVGLGVGSCASLLESVREAMTLGVSLSDALLPITANPAAMLKLAGKGRIAEGQDADFVILDTELRPMDVVAMGRVLVRDGKAVVLGTFEKR